VEEEGKEYNKERKKRGKIAKINKILKNLFMSASVVPHKTTNIYINEC